MSGFVCLANVLKKAWGSIGKSYDVSIVTLCPNRVTYNVSGLHAVRDYYHQTSIRSTNVQPCTKLSYEALNPALSCSPCCMQWCCSIEGVSSEVRTMFVQSCLDSLLVCVVSALCGWEVLFFLREGNFLFFNLFWQEKSILYCNLWVCGWLFAGIAIVYAFVCELISIK